MSEWYTDYQAERQSWDAQDLAIDLNAIMGRMAGRLNGMIRPALDKMLDAFSGLRPGWPVDDELNLEDFTVPDTLPAEWCEWYLTGID